MTLLLRTWYGLTKLFIIISYQDYPHLRCEPLQINFNQIVSWCPNYATPLTQSNFSILTYSVHLMYRMSQYFFPLIVYHGSCLVHTLNPFYDGQGDSINCVRSKVERDGVGVKIRVHFHCVLHANKSLG